MSKLLTLYGQGKKLCSQVKVHRHTTLKDVFFDLQEELVPKKTNDKDESMI